MEKKEKEQKFSKTRKAIIFTLIALIIVTQGIKFISKKNDSDKAEKTNVSISSIETSKPQIVLIEPVTTPEPEDVNLYAQLIYEEENISNIVAQGMNFDDFSTFNEEAVGVLAIPGTNIYYPVCGSNSDSQWLETLFNGKESAYGTVFLDFTNVKDFTGKVSTLFGHNMKDGRMFANLNKYLESSSYFENHDYAFLSTKDYIYVYKFACASKVLETSVKDLRASYFENDEEYTKYLELLKSGIKFQDETVNLENSEHLLQLITCCGNKKYRTIIDFSYQYSIPNILSNNQTTEEIQNNINEITRKRNSFVSMAKNIVSYNLSYDANYMFVQGLNDSAFIWTKDKLDEKEREAFIEMYEISNLIFINGHNSFDIDGKKIAIESINNSTSVFCEENAIKIIKSGKVSVGIEKSSDNKRSLNNYD